MHSQRARTIIGALLAALAICVLMRSAVAGIGGGPTPVPRETATRPLKSEQFHDYGNP